MKIGLISDVHDDLEGLQQALNLLAEKNVSHILCAGDLVDRGIAGDAVIARIREQKIPCVHGNHDLWALERQHSNTDDPDVTFEGPRLSTDSLAFLKSLPHKRKFTFGNKRLLLAHATPWDVVAYIYPRKNPEDFHRVMDAAGSDIDVVVLGHSHYPMIVCLENRGCIINPGSVYSSWPLDFDTDIRKRRCATLTIPDIKAVFYDVDSGEEIEPAFVRIS